MSQMQYTLKHYDKTPSFPNLSFPILILRIPIAGIINTIWLVQNYDNITG